MSITQRISDYLRERRIRRLQRDFKAAYAVANKRLALSLWHRMRDEIDSRSPDQVRRMERARGIRHA
jgi:hypothetical protein